MLRKLVLPAVLLAALLSARPTEARASRTALSISSTPSGASVWVDGVAAGKTPLKLKSLAPGTHQVELARAGYRPFSRSVNLRAGRTVKLKARLKKAKRLPNEERALRQAVLSRELSGVRELQTIVGSALVVSTLPGEGGQDPGSGLYLRVSTGTDLQGRPVVTAQFYLDPGLTQPAGTMTIALNQFQSTVDYQFTAGELAGASGYLSAATAGPGTFLIDGSGTMTGGAAWTALLQLTLAETGATLVGNASVTPEGGPTSHWTLSADTAAQTIEITTPEGFTVAHQTVRDGNARGTLKLTATGTMLATYFVTAGGELVVVFPDGRRAVVQL